VPGPFDTTTKYLVQTYPTDWVTFVGLGATTMPEPVVVVDANLSAVSAEVDKVVRVGDADPWLVHLEFQSTYDPTIGQRLLRYSSMLHLQHQIPVASVLVLLRPEADGSAIGGEYRLGLPGSEPYLWFKYEVRRIWQESARTLLAGALGTLPLAALGADSPAEVPALLRAMEERFAREAPPAEAARLRVVTYTLLGLRYPRDVANQLMRGLRNMRDSSTYQAILDEGRVEGRAEGRGDEARALLVHLGTRRFGSPDARTQAVLDAVHDPEQLDRWCRRLLDVESWQELLATP
jgi:predicted transposase YdaD